MSKTILFFGVMDEDVVVCCWHEDENPSAVKVTFMSPPNNPVTEETKKGYLKKLEKDILSNFDKPKTIDRYTFQESQEWILADLMVHIGYMMADTCPEDARIIVEDDGPKSGPVGHA